MSDVAAYYVLMCALFPVQGGRVCVTQYTLLFRNFKFVQLVTSLSLERSVLSYMWVCGGQIVTGTIFPHRNLHCPVM